jgi:hypothetical protein
MISRRYIVIGLVCIIAQSARSDFDAGVAAYERRDCSVAERELRPVAEAGGAIAQRLMGWLAFRCGDPVPFKYHGTDEQTFQAIAGGRADAAARLSFEYDWTMPSPRDIGAAVKWFAQAARSNDAVAQYMYASFLDRGFGVKQDHFAALTLLQNAAVCDDIRGDYFLAIHYRDGLGAPLNLHLAFKWFHTATERGDLEASAELGRIYLYGAGVPSNYSEALKWLTPPAESGHGPAQYRLGIMYRDGLGVPQDFIQAYKWFFLAKRASFPTGIAESLQGDVTHDWLEISDRMTPAQIGEAINLVTGWNRVKARGRKRSCSEVECCQR